MSREVLGQAEGYPGLGLAGLGPDAPDIPTWAVRLRPPAPAVPLDDLPRATMADPADTPSSTDGSSTDGAGPRRTDEATSHSPRWRAVPRRRDVAFGVGVLLAGGTLGWAGPLLGSTSGIPRDPRTADPASAAVLTVRPDQGPPGDVARPWIVAARVRVTALGHQAITVVDTGAPITAAEPLRLTPSPLTVPAGAGRELTIAVRLDCASPQQLDLPGLRVQRADGLRSLIPLDGAAAELTRLCSTAFPDQVIRLVRLVRDDHRLRVDLTVPGGRTVRILEFAAGGIPLTGRPVPVNVDGQVRSIWLDPPTECAPGWRESGLPTTLDLTLTGLVDTVHGATRAHRRVLVDVPLARWLLETACPR